MDARPSISLFLPAHNEAANLRPTVDDAVETLRRVAHDYEIVIVNDGSTDETEAVAEYLASLNSRIRVVSHERNLGYGAALQTGIAEARFDYVFFTDADRQFRIVELGKLIEHVPRYKVVIGYRAPRRDPAIRKLYAWGWRMLNRLVFGIKVRDIDCAFKLFERKTVQSLNLRAKGAMASAEILVRLGQKSIEIQEIPVTHLPRRAGRPSGGNPNVIIQALREMISLYFRELGSESHRELVKYAIVGIANTLVDLFAYIFLTRFLSFFEARIVLAKIVSFFLGTISSFVLNRNWTFRVDRRITVTELARFYSAVVASLFINAISMHVLANRLGLHDIAAAAVSTSITFAWNFVSNKFWVFSKKRHGSIFSLMRSIFMRHRWTRMILKP